MTGGAKLAAALGRFWRDQRGVSMAIAALLLPIMVGMAGYTIDMSRALWVQRQLQASSDAAALAGATYVASDPSLATSTAQSYSGLSGQKNEVRGASSVTFTSGSPTLKCFASVKVPACSAGAGTYNGIVVSQQAVLPTYFLKIVGINTFTLRSIATASARGGSGQPLDVMVVLDTTASMGETDPGCSIAGATKAQCAKAGMYALLQGLNPATDKVGFMVFPGLNSSGVTAQTTCPGSNLKSSDLADYKSIDPLVTSGSPGYGLTALGGGFASGGKLDSSNLAVIAAGGGGSGCKGIQSLGGKKTFFADAIAAAKAALDADYAPTSQKVIVLLSDGDANADSSVMLSSKVANQCQQAIVNSQAAATAKMWVYSIAYGAATSGGCSTDTKNLVPVNKKGITPCQTMAAIASDSSKFFADGFGKSGCVGTGGNSNDLVDIFKRISLDLTKPRLLPNSTT